MRGYLTNFIYAQILDVLSGIIGEPDDIDEAVNLVKELLYLFIEKSENGVEDNFLSHSILLFVLIYRHFFCLMRPFNL